MDYRDLFEQVRLRPGMYGLDGSYGQFAAYIGGVDAGNDHSLLTGFREWLIVELGDGNNLSWSALVVHLAFPARPSWPTGRLVPDSEENRVAVDTLFRLLDEFLALRMESGAMARIFDDYLTWLTAQGFAVPRRPAS